MSPGIIAESDLSGNLKSEYVFFDGKRVARKDFPGGAVSYYFSDDLQTASVITNAAGTITEDEDYYPWGGEIPFVNSDSNHYKFTSKERDIETGLDYFGARHYSNWLGRFITPDWSSAPVPVPYAALGDPQTLNQYTYVRNIPTSAVDPDGHFIAPTVGINENDGLRSLQLPGQGCPSGAVCTTNPPIGLPIRNIAAGANWTTGVVQHPALTAQLTNIKDSMKKWRRNTTAIFDFLLPLIGFIDGGEGVVEFQGETGEIDPALVRFSQESAGAGFKDSTGSINDLAAGLKDGTIDPGSVPPIRLVEKNGKLYTLDNRRLAAFQKAGVPVRYRMATPEEASREAWKFTSTNDGTSIRIRGQE